MHGGGAGGNRGGERGDVVWGDTKRAHGGTCWGRRMRWTWRDAGNG